MQIVDKDCEPFLKERNWMLHAKNCLVDTLLFNWNLHWTLKEQRGN